MAMRFYSLVTTDSSGRAIVDVNKNGKLDGDETTNFSSIQLSAYNTYLVKELRTPFGFTTDLGYYTVAFDNMSTNIVSCEQRICQ